MASVASGVTWFVLCMNPRRAEITVVAIELADAAGIAHLLKYDTSHGRFAWDVRQGESKCLLATMPFVFCMNLP